MLEKLDDFLSNDAKQEILLKNDLQSEGLTTIEQYEHLDQIHKQLEFIGRMYTMDSKKYARQSEYWLSYAEKVLELLSGVREMPEEAR